MKKSEKNSTSNQSDSNVISFAAFKRAKKIVLLEEDDCPRPFHLKEHVYQDEDSFSFCALCDVRVVIQQHPSMGDDWEWYG